MDPNANYGSARAISIEAATQLFGPSSCEAIAVTKAWYAVGVGDNYTDLFLNYQSPGRMFCAPRRPILSDCHLGQALYGVVEEVGLMWRPMGLLQL